MEISNFFIDKTEILILKPDDFINFNCADKKIIDSFITKITSETGIPKEFLVHKNFYESYLWNWYKFDNIWYYYKRYKSGQQFLNELLGEIISEYFELDTVHYKITKLHLPNRQENFGITSKNFYNKNCIYKRTFDYNFNFYTDLRILKNCRSICKSEDEYLDLLKEIKKLFIRDFYVSQQDRSGRNFQFKIDNKIKLAPLYDYEDSFVQNASLAQFYWAYKTYNNSPLSIYANQLGTLNMEDEKTQELLRNDNYFQELIYKLLNANISEMLNEVENRHMIFIPKNYKQYYMNHESKIKKIILENKLNN